MIRRFALAMSGLLMTIACGDSVSTPPAAPSAGVPFTISDLQVGTGPSPTVGMPVTVNYAGWLYDANAPDNKGQLFDQGQITFTYGVGNVIAGWDQGLGTMQVGGTRRLIIPPELAYGSSGAGGGAIPPNATLIFDVELVSIP